MVEEGAQVGGVADGAVAEALVGEELGEERVEKVAGFRRADAAEGGEDDREERAVHLDATL